MTAPAKVLLAYPAGNGCDSLQRRLLSDSTLAPLDPVHDLSATFHVAEHQVPDYALVARSLAQVAEFEVLKKLLDILEINCAIVEDIAGNDASPTTFSEAGDLRRLGFDFTTAELLATAPPLQPVAAIQAGTGLRATMDMRFDRRRVILIGASTGGVDALLQVLEEFPTNCPPTLIVQHTGDKFQASLVRLLDQFSPPKVVEASHGAALQPGCVMVAPGGENHLHLGAQNGRLICRVKPGPPVSGHAPSVDVLFHSAKPVAPYASAAILTGMGRDGAEGLLALRQAGATTFGQDQASCIVYGMPKVAWDIGAVSRQYRLSEIGPALLRSCVEHTENSKVRTG